MSLRLRLALWYGALTTLVVALVCAYSYAVHSRTHYDELDRVLHSVAEHVAEELEADKTNRAEVLHASLLLGAGVRILDRSGRVLDESRAAAAAPPIDLHRLVTSRTRPPYSAIAGLAPALHMPESAPGRFGLLATSRHDERYRVYVMSIRDSAEYLAVTARLTHIDTAIGGFARLMWVMAIAGGLVAFIVGWLLAQHALRPVTMLTSTAASIAESRELSRRVPDGSARDELGRLARTFNAMLASLEAAYESQVRFVSAASHELRAPLTVVQANLDLLRSGKMSESERTTALAEAHTETSRMTRLVADLLVLARADAGVPIRREGVELDRVVLQVIGEARHLANGQRLEVTEVAPIVIRGDADRLKQLFLNVVENAIKYTPASGRVRVGIRRDAGAAVITVSDAGVGISSADLPHVLERFYRADPARSRDPGGSGLGLSIADWVAKQHGGSINISSKLGEGTTVTIRLPVEA